MHSRISLVKGAAQLGNLSVARKPGRASSKSSVAPCTCAMLATRLNPRPLPGVELLWDKLSDALNDAQKKNKICNLLNTLRVDGVILNAGSKAAPEWMARE